jgi:hypothetical protein
MSLDEHLRLVQQAKPLLAGISPETQMSVLAELVALWLAGHYAAGADDRRALRNEMFDLFTRLVSDLVPALESEVLATFKLKGEK